MKRPFRKGTTAGIGDLRSPRLLKTYIVGAKDWNIKLPVEMVIPLPVLFPGPLLTLNKNAQFFGGSQAKESGCNVWCLEMR